MIHVYKKSTNKEEKCWKTKKGLKYLIKSINPKDVEKFKALGYSTTLEGVFENGNNKGGDSKPGTS